MNNRRKNKKGKVLKVLFTLLLVLGAIGYGLYYFGIIGDDGIKKEKEPELKILDLDSNTRPYAVMIDNVAQARPHSGLDKAYLVYEIIVEGNLTRLMAVFRDVKVDEIGPIRSARPYFVDYVLENDAIYVHHGRSPQAKEQIDEYDVEDLEGLFNPAGMFWRDQNRYAPHNSYTSTDGIKDGNALRYEDIISIDIDMEKLQYHMKKFNEGILPPYDEDKKETTETKPIKLKVESQPFGWLSPTGEFIKGDWGEHEGIAIEIVKQKHLESDYNEWRMKDDGHILYRDYLINVKGYALIHNPSMYGNYIVTHTKELTKRQKDFLYGYFIDMGDAWSAERYLND